MEQLNSRTASPYSYRNLDVWQKARALTAEVMQIINGLPRTNASDVIGKQILQSSTSIGANIAEGHGRFSFAAFRNHLLIARGSATETDNWLTVLLDARLIDELIESKLHRDCHVLIAALTNHIRSINRRLAKSSTLKENPAEYKAGQTAEDFDELFDCSIVQLAEELANDKNS